MLTAPFDLATFPFTRGDDDVDVSSVATPPPSGRFPAIFNDGVVRMLSGNNTVMGAITGLGSSSISEFVGIANRGRLLGGDDVDVVKGSVTVSDPIEERFFNPVFIGISGEVVGNEDAAGRIRLGAGEDTVMGTVDIPFIEDSSGTSGFGLRGLVLDTGRDNDTVVGQATIAGRSSNIGETVAYGIADTLLRTGTGADSVNGVGVGQSGTQVFAAGILGSTIDTVLDFGGFFSFLASIFDRGNDSIVATGEATGIIANAFGLINTDVRTGFGADAVTGQATGTGQTE
ncbi:MAG: hypothetical protein AAGF58_17330, partial [Pseudomonadota bacterium]